MGRLSFRQLGSATLVILAGGDAEAHQYAASGFDAVTEERDVHVQLRLDATSVVEMLNRTFPDGSAIGREGIGAHPAVLPGYLLERFGIRNDEAACSGSVQGRPHLDPQTDKVVVAVVFRCARDLDILTLESRLFSEEETPHQVLGTFRHVRAVEHYLLTPNVREAVIPLRRLAQVAPVEAARPGQFRVATPPPGTFSGARGAVGKPIGSGFLTFIREGIGHILGGLDHVLFVLALVSVVGSWRDLVKVVTSFTAAHSLTLALGVLDLVRVSPRLIEPLIAVSIVCVAMQNLRRAEPQARARVTFAFGLVHGFGFSSALRDLGLPTGSLVPALLGFNLGVEMGQLMIVAPLAPLVWWLRGRELVYRRVRLGMNGSVAVVAGWWFVERVLHG